MLKQITVNRQRLPVPVPVHDLSDALGWVSEALMKRGAIITRLVLDGEELNLGADGSLSEQNRELLPESRLEISLDTPIDLCVQTIDATKNLAILIRGCLRGIAVECWSAVPSKPPAGVSALRDDLELVTDLLDHLSVLVEGTQVEKKTFLEISGNIVAIVKSFEMARNSGDWKALARILLNRLEPQTKELVFELDALQSNILALKCQGMPASG